MIEVNELTKYYGQKLAVDSVSFFVDAGEVVGLLGPNGAGKSTIMRILTGFLPPSSGVARIAGFDVMQNPVEAKKRIGYLPETPPLYKEMRVSEYLRFCAALKRVPPPRRGAAVARAIEQCGLQDMARRRIEHLSKGFRQRVGLAQAIVHSPPLMILDEPTSGLDPMQVIEVRALMRRLAQEVTILVSSHVLTEVEATCGRVIIINRGKLVAIADPADLRDRLRGAGEQVVVLEFGGDADAIIGKLRALESVQIVLEIERAKREGRPRSLCRVTCRSDQDAPTRLAACVLDSGGALISLREEQPSLEQAFIQLTREEPHREEPHREEPQREGPQ